MVQSSRRAGWPDAALVRLLARLAALDQDAGSGQQTFADRLGQWLRWTDAMPLYAALEDGSAPPADDTPPADAGQAARVRAALGASLEQNLPWRQPDKPGRRKRAHLPAPRATPAPGPMLETKTEFAPYRRHYQGRQIAMENAIEALRAGLRAQWLASAPQQAALVAVDAVLERVLGAHERRLLMGVPAMLEQRFARLRAAAEADPAAHGNWLPAFQDDLLAVLAAELDVRWQPIEALLAALPTPQDHA